MNNKSVSIKALSRQFPQTGRLQWIGLRPAKNETMKSVAQAFACSQDGLIGDRYSGKSGKRQVSLIQYEHLAVIAALSGKTLTAECLRRNLVISKINLMALKNHYFQIGEAVLYGTGACHPCSKMERVLGNGGYNAMRGHGGITATVIESGNIYVGNDVIVLLDYENQGLSDLR